MKTNVRWETIKWFPLLHIRFCIQFPISGYSKLLKLYLNSSKLFSTIISRFVELTYMNWTCCLTQRSMASRQIGDAVYNSEYCSRQRWPWPVTKPMITQLLPTSTWQQSLVDLCSKSRTR